MNRCIFSTDRVYRYVLCHRFVDSIPERTSDLGDVEYNPDKAQKRIAWIGLNPSTADEFTFDPTLAAVCRFSRKWGYSEVVMLNLFAFRATAPRDLKKAADPIGPDNDRHLLAEVHGIERVMVCWGEHGQFRGRDRQVTDLLATIGIAFESE